MDIISNQKEVRGRRVLEFLSNPAHAEKIDSVPMFAEDVELLKETLAEIKSLSLAQLEPSRGKTQVKSDARGEMCDAALELAARVKTFAVRTDDQELKARVKVTRTDLLYRRETDGLKKARRIVEIAREVQPEMADAYKLTPEMIDEIEEKVEAFETAINGPALAIDARAVTTESIEEAVARLGELLTDRINVHIDTLRRSHPDFAAAYDQVNTLEKRRGTRGVSAAEDQGVENGALEMAIESLTPASSNGDSGVEESNRLATATGNGSESESRLPSPEVELVN